jgi:hypothetical protein
MGAGKGFINTETVEKQYWERGGIVPKITDHSVINLNPDSDSDSNCENSYELGLSE